MKTTVKLLALPGFLIWSSLLSAQDPIDPDTTPDAAHGDPFTPVGSIQVTPTVVQPGVQPNMTWEIEYPKSVGDLTLIIPPGKLVTTNDKPDTLCVRVAGVSYSADGVDLPVALWIRVNGGGWQLLFYGRGKDVDPSSILYKEPIVEGTSVDFAARGRTASGSWYATQWTLADTPNIAALISGDPVPAESPAFLDGSIESFMTQFVDDSNHVVASPRDIVYLFELGSTEPGTSFFDMQDLVTVVSFCKTNRGHGNNEDGFDSDNTGVGTSGVGGVDNTTGSAGYLDDEGTRIKKKEL